MILIFVLLICMVFSNGLSMLQALCNNNDIILIQEHWLHSHEFHKFSDLFDDFNVYSISSMDEKFSSGLLIGRPFSGISILWRKALIFVCNLLIKMMVVDTSLVC